MVTLVNINAQIRMILLGSNADLRAELRQHLSVLDFRNFRKCGTARDLFHYLEYASASVIFAKSNISDMHWTAMLRTLCSDKELFYVSLVFIFERVVPDRSADHPDIINQAILDKRCCALAEPEKSMAKAILASPDDDRLHNNLALVCFDSRLQAKAAHGLERALEINPGNERAARKLGELKIAATPL